MPDGYEFGWTFIAPVIEMPVYLDWLAALVLERGGTITRMNLSGLPTGADVVVNCSGIASRFLADDDTVSPVQGQVVVVEQVGLEHWWLDGAGPTYVVPRSRDIVDRWHRRRGGVEPHAVARGRLGDPADAARSAGPARLRSGAEVLGHHVGHCGPRDRRGWLEVAVGDRLTRLLSGTAVARR